MLNCIALPKKFNLFPHAQRRKKLNKDLQVQVSDTTMLMCVIQTVTKKYLTKLYACSCNLISMLLIQLTGLSGSGKTCIAYQVKRWMNTRIEHLNVEVIDADEHRKTVCRDLGFTKEDRIENIRRLGKIADNLVQKNCIAIVAAINP